MIKERLTKRVMALILALAVAFACLTPAAKTEAASKIKISASKKTVTVGASFTLSVKKGKKKISKGIKWSSNKKKVASVTSKGKVKAKKAGTAIITAKYKGKKYKCVVKVNAKSKTTEQKTSEETKVTPTVAPTTAPTAAPTATPEPTATPTPTPDLNDPDVEASTYFKDNVKLEYGTTTIHIDFDLKKDDNGDFDPDEIAELEAQGCTVDHESGNVTKDQVCETVKYTFTKLPENLADIKSFFSEPERNDTAEYGGEGVTNYGGFNAMAATICTAAIFDGTPDPSDPLKEKSPVWNMFEYINGPASTMDISKVSKGTAANSMKSGIQTCGANVYKAFFQGATPKNNYTPDEPYVLELYKGPYYIEGKETITGNRPTTYMILVPGVNSNAKDLLKVAGFDSDRYIDVYYSTRDKRWYSYADQFMHITANGFKVLEEEL